MESEFAQVQVGDPNQGGFTVNAPGGVPTGGIDAIGETIISNFFVIVIVLAIIMVAVFLVWAGILWISSQGDKQKVQAARNRITFAIVGLIIIFSSYFIITLIGHIFGIEVFDR